MAIVNIENIKAKFEAGDHPRSSDYVDMIDTLAALPVASYGSFYDTSTLAISNALATYAIPLNTTAEANGVSIVSGSQIKVNNAGVYNLQFSCQLDKTDNGKDLVNIWLSKNGTNVENSNTQIIVEGNNGKHVAAWNFVLTLAANDYVQIMIQSPDTHMRLVASGVQTSPSRPAVPSSIVTLVQVR
jgi:hypothetical protein